MKTKRFISILLAAVLSVSSLIFCGCKAESDNGETTTTGGSVTVNGNAKRIAFTFDDGPHAPAENLDEGFYPYTTYILDKLESLGMKATFFVVGSRAETYPQALRRAVSLGCEVGSHTYEHITFREKDNAYINGVLDQTSSAIAEAGVPAPRLFRPVGGAITAGQLTAVASKGYTTVGWSVDTEDWNGKPKTGDKFADDPERNKTYEDFVNAKVELIVSQAKDGDIVLMHDIYMSSADIFIRAADRLVADGFVLVTVSELLGLTDSSVAKPVMYISESETITHMN